MCVHVCVYECACVSVHVCVCVYEVCVCVRVMTINTVQQTNLTIFLEASRCREWKCEDMLARAARQLVWRYLSCNVYVTCILGGCFLLFRGLDNVAVIQGVGQ